MTVEEILLDRIKELEKTVSVLSKQNEDYKARVQANNLKEAQKDYKDRVFSSSLVIRKTKPGHYPSTMRLTGRVIRIPMTSSLIQSVVLCT